VSNRKRGGSQARDKGVDSLIKKSRVSRVWCQRRSQRYGIIEIKCRGNVSQKSLTLVRCIEIKCRGNVVQKSLTLVRGIVEETSEGTSVVGMSKKKEGRLEGTSVVGMSEGTSVVGMSKRVEGTSVVGMSEGTSVVGMSKIGEGTSVVGMSKRGEVRP
jgi:hypothetical protein